MKRCIFIFLSIIVSLTVSAQNLYIKIKGNSISENKIIDSLPYNKIHFNAKSVLNEATETANKLTKIGFTETSILENKKVNDSVFEFKFNLGIKTNFIHIYIGSNFKTKDVTIPNLKNDTLVLKFNEMESFMNTTILSLEKKGYSLSKLQLINFIKKKDILYATLYLETDKQRQLNDIIVVGYEKFSQGHKKNIKRSYKNKIFNLETLKKLNSDFNTFRFVIQKKYPEILFSKDSTKVYIYLEKAKSNKFDGLLGFSNDDNSKLQFNGYLDLLLVNTLNSGEAFSVFWKSDGSDQKTFNVGLELPYILKSRFGLKSNLAIFKQDSTFQNTKTSIDLGYFLRYNTRFYLGYQSTESSDIQNQNNFSISDYKNSFTTFSFEFSDFKLDDLLFPENTRIKLKTGFGSRNTITSKNNQIYFDFDFKKNLHINNKNSFNLKSQNFYLQSDAYIINELYRFGGINSIRGFNENSLQANFFTSLLTEYRYVLAKSIYAHTILDYGYYQDKSSNTSNSLLGLGFGFGILTKNGLLNLIYASGTTGNQTITLSNSIVHVSFQTNF